MELYYVKNLARTTPPEGCGKGPWWRYTIECGSSESHSISGVREGKKDEVEKYLDKMLDSINKRTLGHQSKNSDIPIYPPGNAPQSKYSPKDKGFSDAGTQGAGRISLGELGEGLSHQSTG